MDKLQLEIIVPSDLMPHYKNMTLTTDALYKLRKNASQNPMYKYGTLPINNPSDLVVLIFEYMYYLDNIPIEERPVTSIIDFALFIGYDELSIKKLGQSDPQYMNLLAIVADSSKNELQQGGLRGKFTSSQAIFLLKSEHGMEDKTTIEHINTDTPASQINARLIESLDYKVIDTGDVISYKLDKPDKVDEGDKVLDSQNG